MLELIRKYPQLLLFGMLTAMFSGPGQTFLVSVFIPEMRQEFGMSQAKIASFYSIATVASACLLPFTGRILDRIHLTLFTLVAGILLALGCFALSLARGITLLLLGFFLIRNLGQGTMTMITSTTMAKAFGRVRGKAMGIANLGYPLGEAIFPLMISFWIASYGWRSGWVLLASLTFLFFSPAAWILLRKNPHESAKIEYAMTHPESSSDQKSGGRRDGMLKDVLCDIRFYFLIFPILIPPTYLTALFFHQGAFAELKGWPLQLMAAGFVSFAVCRAIVLLIIGPLIDRYTAVRVFPFSLIPLVLGMMALIWGSHWSTVFIYLGGAGITMAFAMTIGSALWAELYGTTHLGSIQGFMFLMVVMATAIAPPLMGWMLDSQWNMIGILWGMIGLTLGAITCAFIGTSIKSQKSGA